MSKPMMYVKETKYSSTIPDFSTRDYVEDDESIEINRGSGLMSEWESKPSVDSTIDLQEIEDSILRLWGILDDLREYAERRFSKRLAERCFNKQLAENTDEDTTEYLQALCLVYEQKFCAAYNKLTKE